MTSAQLHVTKLAAAQRQLRAAIRMFFVGEDALAIHTVASAAYHILSDLKVERGRDEVGDNYLTAIFYCVRDYRRGTLPSYLTEDSEAMKWIKDLAEQVPITVDSSFKDIRASVPPDVAKKYWSKRNKISNFLKHADRDAKSHIIFDEVDNLDLLMHAQSAYIDIGSSGDLGKEGFMLWVYHSVTYGMSEGLPDKYKHIAEKLEKLSPDERLSLCSYMVRGLSVMP